MTSETSSDDASIEIQLSDGEWTVTNAEGIEAEVTTSMADGHGNGRLNVQYHE